MPAIHRSVAFIACLLPALAWALGVGAIDVSSGLNQPFDAKIAIVGAKQGELQDVSAALAEPKAFEAAGLTRSIVLTRLKFEVVATGDDSGYIHVTSRDGIREPALEFIVDVKWGNGGGRPKYSVLLEPR